MGSVVFRATSAWLGAWEFGMAGVAAAMECTSWLDLKEHWPALAATVTNMDAAHSTATGLTAHLSGWTQRVSQGAPKRQRELTAPIMDGAKKNMLRGLDAATKNTHPRGRQQRSETVAPLSRG